MIVLGVLLLLIAAGGVALVALEPTATDATATFTYFGYTLHPSHFEMFLAGAATAAVFLIGLAMIGSGSRRATKRRRLVRAARHRTDEHVAQPGSGNDHDTLVAGGSARHLRDDEAR